MCGGISHTDVQEAQRIYLDFSR